MVVSVSGYLVSVLGDFVKESKLVMIAGHPGSGKTTLAATMCLYAVERGEKCLYISFQEDRERLFKQLAGVGIDFEPFNKRGLLKFIKLPVPASEDAARAFIEELSKIVSEFSPRLIAIDSISPLFINMRDDAEARGYLQNFFWELQKLIKGTVILVSEIPLGQEYTSFGWIEFVADAVLILKHRIQRGLIERVMEVRKIRGRELTVAEIPFSIQNKIGIVVYPPIVLSEVRPGKKKRRFILHGEEFQIPEFVGPAMVVFIDYPPELTLSLPLLYSILTSILSSDNEKILVVEYWFTEEQIRDFLIDNLRFYGANDNTIRYILDRVIIKTLNPTAYSIPERFSQTIEIIEEVNPATAIFHDIAILTTSPSDVSYYITLVYNFLLYLKSRGIDSIRLHSRINPFAELYKVMADHIISILCKDNLCSDYLIYSFLNGRRYSFSWSGLEGFIRKVIEYLNQKQ